MVLLVPLTPTASEAVAGLEVEVLSSPIKKASIKEKEHQPEKPENEKESFQVRTIPGKGMGLFATR